MQDLPVINISDLNKWFGKQHVLRGINLNVMPSDVLAVIGPSGSGKSTLLRCINYLESYDAGKIHVGGQLVSGDEAFVNSLRAKVGMVFQHFHLFPHMTVLGNVMEGPTQVRKIPAKTAHKLALHHLAKVGMSDWAYAYPATLSGGQKQRVAIARTLLKNPRILILDDSTSSVDTETEAEIREALQNLMQNRTTFIIAHRIQSIMDADLILVMDRGRIVQRGQHSDLVAVDGIYRRIYEIQTRIETELEKEIANAG